jgi:uncharacterized protein (TIGR02145 family)
MVQIINKKVTCIYLQLFILFMLVAAGCKKDESTISQVKDGDGNMYNTVTIGDQEWLAENLKTTTLIDGTPIELVTEDVEWQDRTTPGYCFYDNDESTYKDPYGPLYNWFTVNTGKLCPDGWHVPTNDDWATLMDYLGGSNSAGGKLKETGTTHWSNPNQGATNETGFNAVPGGYRNAFNIPSFMDIRDYGAWWSSTEDENNYEYAWYYIMDYFTPDLYNNNYYKKHGFSVRCIKDK